MLSTENNFNNFKIICRTEFLQQKFEELLKWINLSNIFELHVETSFKPLMIYP